jgi:glycerol uptake facilitator-like aquaporin
MPPGAVGAQIAGGTLGAVIANLMFGLPAISVATTARTGPGIWLAEVVATAGLVMVIGGTGRSGRADWTAFAVGGYITAAYWFTSSTSFANPAVTIARMLSDSFAGIAPSSVPLFLLAQVVGGVVGYFLNQSLYPRRRLVGADLRTDEAVDTSPQHPGRGRHEPH